jgi:hypothetical protein
MTSNRKKKCPLCRIGKTFLSYPTNGKLFLSDIMVISYPTNGKLFLSVIMVISYPTNGKSFLSDIMGISFSDWMSLKYIDL